MARRYLSVKELPERPDAETGLPRPPHAPFYLGGGNQRPGEGSGSPPKPPPGLGPVLDWYHPGPSRALAGGSGFASVAAIILTLTRGTDWVKVPGVWAVMAAAVAFGYFALRNARYSAGAEWFAIHDKWIGTYQLVEVTAKASGSGVYLKLKDSDGEILEFKFSDLVGTNRLLYDLVYNGILHSVIAGNAATNSLLHRTLKLPYPESARGMSDHDSRG